VVIVVVVGDGGGKWCRHDSGHSTITDTRGYPRGVYVSVRRDGSVWLRFGRDHASLDVVSLHAVTTRHSSGRSSTSSELACSRSSCTTTTSHCSGSVRRAASLPRQQFPRVASSSHPRRHARHPPASMLRVSGDFPVQVATRLHDWSVGGLLRCSAARLSVCRVVLRIPRARHARLVADKLLASS